MLLRRDLSEVVEFNIVSFLIILQENDVRIQYGDCLPIESNVRGCNCILFFISGIIMFSGTINRKVKDLIVV